MDISRWTVIALGLGLVACGRQDNLDLRELDPPAAPGATVTMRPLGDEGQVDMAVGQTLALQMKSHFEWREAAAPTLLDRDDILWAPADRAGRDQGATGAESWQVFVYRAVEPGEETLTLVEARPWEPDQVVDRYTLTIRIRP